MAKKGVRTRGGDQSPASGDSTPENPQDRDGMSRKPVIVSLKSRLEAKSKI